MEIMHKLCLLYHFTISMSCYYWTFQLFRSHWLNNHIPHTEALLLTNDNLSPRWELFRYNAFKYYSTYKHPPSLSHPAIIWLSIRYIKTMGYLEYAAVDFFPISKFRSISSRKVFCCFSLQKWWTRSYATNGLTSVQPRQNGITLFITSWRASSITYILIILPLSFFLYPFLDACFSVAKYKTYVL